MNRTIKFRIWNTAKKCFYTEDHVKSNLFNYLERTQEPVMQFTGLKDKNGKEIYEGDIIEWFGYGKLGPGTVRNVNGPVRYDEGFGGYRAENYLPLNLIQTGQVLGNIYENPELLK